MKKRVDLAALTPVVGTLYPPPLDVLSCRIRARTEKLLLFGGAIQLAGEAFPQV